MTIQTFPTLRNNMSYPVTRTSMVDTTRVAAWSGRRSAIPHWSYPIYKFNINFQYLANSTTYTDWPTLQGFWNTVMTSPGQYFFFNFREDNTATANLFGTGNASTTTFQLARTLGSFTEPVYGPVTYSVYMSDWRGNQLQYTTARTNRALQANDLTNASWTKTTATVAKDQTGPDGVSNSASSFLATSANATVTQTFSLSNIARTYGVWLKRITGTGNVQLTLDGSTWTTKTITSSWAFYSITQTLINPTIGIRLVTNTDKVAVAYNQLEDGSTTTSSIATTTVAVTVTDYAMSATGIATFSTAPATGNLLTWTGTFAWLCQFDQDSADWGNFMYQFWDLKQLTFNTVIVP